MLPAPSFDDIMRRADILGRSQPLCDRVVSIVFADPASPIWQELRINRAFLDERTGDRWDLFFAGISAYAPMTAEPGAVMIRAHRDFPAYFNPRLFGEVESEITEGHRAALQADESTNPPWIYQGGTEVVSFMAYSGQPDWLSLKSAALYAPQGGDIRLVHIVEGLRSWQDDAANPLFAPGETQLLKFSSLGLLVSGLGCTASSAAAGVIGNAAFGALLAALTGH